MPDCAKDVLSYIDAHRGHASRTDMIRHFGGSYELQGVSWLEGFKYVVVFYDDVYRYSEERF
jgi:hypothetical protein